MWENFVKDVPKLRELWELCWMSDYVVRDVMNITKKYGGAVLKVRKISKRSTEYEKIY